MQMVTLFTILMIWPITVLEAKLHLLLIFSLIALMMENTSAHIACITYTNAAAIEIKNRASVKNLRVSTIHDFLWDSIAQFQKELKVTLLELINEPDNVIKSPTPGEIYSNEFENGIQYKEYVRISNGEISHDEVLLLAHRMFKKYPRLCDLLLDKFQFIFVDEYQDNLVVYYPSPSDEVLEGAVSLFGRDNCIDLDAE